MGKFLVVFSILPSVPWAPLRGPMLQIRQSQTPLDMSGIALIRRPSQGASPARIVKPSKMYPQHL